MLREEQAQASRESLVAWTSSEAGVLSIRLTFTPVAGDGQSFARMDSLTIESKVAKINNYLT